MTGFQGEAESTVKSTFGKLAKVATAGLAVAGVGEFIKGAVEGAAKVQKSAEAIQLEFGGASKSVTDFGESAAKQFGLSTQTVDAASARFGILFQNLGIGKGRAAEMTVNMEKLAGSLANIRGTDPSEILAKLPTALAGNMRSLKDMGFAFSQAQIAQEAMKIGAVDATAQTEKQTAAHDRLVVAQAKATEATKKYGAGSQEAVAAQAQLSTAQLAVQKATESVATQLTSGQKAQAIYSLITQNLTTYEKQAAGSKGDLVNQQRILTAEFENADRQIGTALLPALAAVTHFLAAALPSALEVGRVAIHTVIDAFTTLYGVVQPALQPVIDEVKRLKDTFTEGGIAAVIQNIREQFSRMSPAARDLAIGATALAVGIKLVNVAMDANPMTRFVVGLVAVTEAFKVAYRESATFRRIVDEALTFIRTEWDTHAAAIKKTAMEAWNTIKLTITTAVTDSRKVVADTVAAVKAIWARFHTEITAVAKAEWDTIKAVVTTAIYAIRDVIRVVLDIIHGNWGKAWGDLKGLVSDVLQGVETIITNQGTVLYNGMQILGSLLLQGLKAGLVGIAGFFAGIWDGIKSGFQTAMDAIYRVALVTVEQIVEPFTHLPARLGGWARKIKDNVHLELAKLQPDSKELAAAIGDDFGNKLVDTTKPHLDTLSKNIQDALSNPQIDAAAQKTVDAVNNAIATVGASQVAGGGGSIPTSSAVKTAIAAASQAGAATAGKYVFPFSAGLTTGRIDQGQDFGGSGTIRTIGDATFVRVSPQGSGSGWPGGGKGGGAMIVYQLKGGPNDGQFIYTAENVNPLPWVKPGVTVKAGTPFANAPGGYPFIETGFSNAGGTPISHGSYTEGAQTAGGLAFKSLIDSLRGGGTAAALPTTPSGADLAANKAAADQAKAAAKAAAAQTKATAREAAREASQRLTELFSEFRGKFAQATATVSQGEIAAVKKRVGAEKDGVDATLTTQLRGVHTRLTAEKDSVDTTLAKQIGGVRTHLAAQKEAITEARTAALTEVKNTTDAKLRGITAERQAEVAKINETLQRNLDGARATHEATMAGFQTAHDQAVKNANEEKTNRLAAIDATLQAALKAAQREHDDTTSNLQSAHDDQIAQILAQQAVKTSAEQQLADLQAQHAEGQRNDALAKAQADQAALQASGTATPDQLTAAAAAVTAAQYDITVAGLQAQADAERLAADQKAAADQKTADADLKLNQSTIDLKYQDDVDAANGQADFDRTVAETNAERAQTIADNLLTIQQGGEDARYQSQVTALNATATADKNAAATKATNEAAVVRASKKTQDDAITEKFRGQDHADTVAAGAQITHFRKLAKQEKTRYTETATAEETHFRTLAKQEKKRYDDAATAEETFIKEQTKKADKSYTERLKALQLHLKDTKTAWTTSKKDILKLFDDSVTDYKKSGAALAEAFAGGISSAAHDVETAASTVAGGAAKFLKLSSPAAEGPMSDLDTWWSALGTTLLQGVDPHGLGAGLTDALRLGPTTAGTGGGPLLTGIQLLHRDEITLAQQAAAQHAELLGELQKQTEILTTAPRHVVAARAPAPDLALTVAR